MNYNKVFNKYRRHKRIRYKTAGVGTHLILPAIGGGVAGLLTLLNMAKTKSSFKEKLKRLIRNAALGTLVGGGLEASRVGLTGLYDAVTNDDVPIDGMPTADGNFLRYK